MSGKIPDFLDGKKIVMSQTVKQLTMYRKTTLFYLIKGKNPDVTHANVAILLTKRTSYVPYG